MSNPPLSHPANQLPRAGDRPYVPPRERGNPSIKRARGGGLVDRQGNVWVWARDKHGGDHWDVQHANGTHTNVFPDGSVLGHDNFPG